jgi:mannose-6-phosphate isomerase-like protein (cupin superfamily)
MPIIKSSDAPKFEVPGLTVTGFASPSRGARETSTWQLVIAPGSPGALHSCDREEIFVVLSGTARATLADQPLDLAAGDTLIVPAHTPFSLANPGSEPCTAIAMLPIGGQAAMPGGAPFVPPWAS